MVARIACVEQVHPAAARWSRERLFAVVFGMYQNGAVARPAGWRNTVEHVDPALDRLKDVDDLADAEQMTWAVVGQQRDSPVQNAMLIALRLAERAADAVCPERQR